MIDIIVVNYNSHIWLEKLLNSIKETTREDDCRIIIVDNGSTEKDNLEYLSSSEIRRNHQVLFLSENVGYGQAIMEAYKHISEGKIFIFASSDVELLSSGWLESLLKPFEDEKVGLVAPKLILSNGNLGGTGFIGDEKAPIIRGWNEIDRGQYKQEEVLVVCGAFCAVQREAFEKVGGFDPIFELYFEDFDLSYKMRKAGYKVIFNPDVEILHYFNKSPDIEKRRKYIDSLALFALKWNCSKEWVYKQVSSEDEKRQLDGLFEEKK